MNGAHLTQKKALKKIKIVHYKILVILNMQNILDLYQILNIQTLQVMELIPKKLCSPCDFFKIQKYNFKQCPPI
jgi:hypothetical protein